MRAQGPVCADIGILSLGRQIVEVPAALGTENDAARAGTKSGRCAGRQCAHIVQRNLGRVNRIDRLAFVITARKLGFGRKIWCPVGKPLAHGRFQFFDLSEQVGTQRQLVREITRKLRLGLFGLCVTQACPVLSVDVPVKFGQRVLDNKLSAFRRSGADIQLVLTGRKRLGRRNRGRRDRDVCQATAQWAKFGRATGTFQFLVTDEEEQLVLEDWAA